MFEKEIQYQLADGDDVEESSRPPACTLVAQSTYMQVMLVLLLLSCVVNIGFAVDKVTHSTTRIRPTSRYASLQYDTPRPFQHSTEYSSSNGTRMQELWDNIDIDAGMIYISPEYADSMELLPSQSFPWDPNLKIYFLNAYHNLHCLKSIQKSLADLDAGRPPTYPMGHVMHCLDALRDDVLCHADDTPRYTTATSEPESGIGQLRQCRNWSKLEAWAEHFSGCWHYINVHYDQRNELERWRYCEPGSPYYERVQRWTEKHQKELA